MVDLRTSGEALSQIIGWSYFLCWTISFYPQVYRPRTQSSQTGDLEFPAKIRGRFERGLYRP